MNSMELYRYCSGREVDIITCRVRVRIILFNACTVVGDAV